MMKGMNEYFYVFLVYNFYLVQSMVFIRSNLCGVFKFGIYYDNGVLILLVCVEQCLNKFFFDIWLFKFDGKVLKLSCIFVINRLMNFLDF